jgi:hypothetical protein
MRYNQPRYLGLLAILVGATIGCVNLAHGQSQAPILDRPLVPSVGDTFTYKYNGETVAMTYVSRDRDLYCYSARASGARQSNICRTSEGNPVRSVGSWQPVTFTPYRPILSFPLFVGKRWELSYTLHRGFQGSEHSVAATGQAHYEMNTNRIMRARVVSYEKVTVPAGTFDAFKIEAVDGPWGMTIPLSVIYYYSPEVGLVKSDADTLDGDHIELVSYTRTK